MGALTASHPCSIIFLTYLTALPSFFVFILTNRFLNSNAASYFLAKDLNPETIIRHASRLRIFTKSPLSMRADYGTTCWHALL